MSPDSLCRWQVDVSVYCVRQTPAHLRCTQCSILLHIFDISFPPCICLWQISKIQTCLSVVVGPGFVLTSSAFMRSSARHPADPHDRLVQTNGKSGPHCWGREVSTQFGQQLAETAVTDPPLVGCVVWRLALDMSKDYDTINIHKLIRTLLQTKIPGTIIKFIANYIKERKAYTTYRSHTFPERQFKTGVRQGDVLSLTLFNIYIYIADITLPREQVQVMVYADDITINSTHTSTSSAKTYIQPYLHKVFGWTKENNLINITNKTPPNHSQTKINQRTKTSSYFK